MELGIEILSEMNYTDLTVKPFSIVTALIHVFADKCTRLKNLNLVDDPVDLADIGSSVVALVGYVETVVAVVPEIVVVGYVETVVVLVGYVETVVVVVPEIVVVLEIAVRLGGPGVHGHVHYLGEGLQEGMHHAVMKH